MTKSRRHWYIHALLKRLFDYTVLFLFLLVCCIDWDKTLANFGF